MPLPSFAPRYFHTRHWVSQGASYIQHYDSATVRSPVWALSAQLDHTCTKPFLFPVYTSFPLLIVEQGSHVLQRIARRGDELVVGPPQPRSSLCCHFCQQLPREDVADIDCAHCRKEGRSTSQALAATCQTCRTCCAAHPQWKAVHSTQEENSLLAVCVSSQGSPVYGPEETLP